MECYACTATSQLTPSPVQVWTDPTEEITCSNRTETTILPALRRSTWPIIKDCNPRFLSSGINLTACQESF